MTFRKIAIPSLLFTFACLLPSRAADRRVDPTFLHRTLSTAPEKKSDITTATCHYKPLFGEGDADASAPVGIARYGEAIVDANGACAASSYSQEIKSV